MATITAQPKIEVMIDFQVTEAEARALSLLVEYDHADLIRAIGLTLGDSQYLRHAAGFESFWSSVRSFLPGILGRVDQMRQPVKPVELVPHRRATPEFS